MTKNSLIVALGVVILGAAVVGGALYTRTWNPIWNPFRPKPEEVITKAFSTRFNTAHSVVNFGVGVKNEQIFKLAITAEQDSDITDRKNPRFKGNFGAEFSAKGKGLVLSLAASSIVISDDLYFKLTTIPSFPGMDMSLQQMGIDISAIQNQWFKLNREKLQESITKWATKLGMPQDEAYLEQWKQQNEKAKKMQAELQKEVKKIIKGKKLYVVKKQLPDEKVNNTATYHYMVALDKEGIKGLVPDLVDVGLKLANKYFGDQPGFQLPTKEEKAKGVSEIQNGIDKLFNTIGELKAEIWIGKKDNYFYRIKTSKTIDISKFDEKQKGAVDVNLSADFSNYNKPVTIKPPAEFKSLIEFIDDYIQRMGAMGSMMGSPSLTPTLPSGSKEMPSRKPPVSISSSSPTLFPGLLGAAAKAKDARVRADMAQMRTIAALFESEENSYTNLRCENSKSTYSSDMKALCDDVEKQSGTPLVIHSSDKKYCTYSRLLVPENGQSQYYCIDSSGKAVQVSVNPGQGGYCTGTTFVCPAGE